MALVHQPLKPSTSRRSPKAMLLVTWSPANDIFYEPSEHPSTTLGSTSFVNWFDSCSVVGVFVFIRHLP
ncbi:hypothetical protein WN944_023638 [Citrus x changshan-huyou]|uniref:Uncharacterized protein n=1 Tax=Citrus x changshan-huyou TaxID=2935761 RepID=A0AAP0N346_9ROSI